MILEYWTGVTECCCKSEHPIGACLHCDLRRVQKELAAMTAAKDRAVGALKECADRLAYEGGDSIKYVKVIAELEEVE